MHARTTIILAALAAATPAALAQLDPPPGPVEPSFKTLDQVEPSIPVGPETTPGNAQALYVIDRPGAFHLTSNIELDDAGTHCVLITSDGVTLDLRGHEISSTRSAPALIYGDSASNLAIRNGSLRSDHSCDAIELRIGSASTIENVRIKHVRNGIITGRNSLVSRCQVWGAQEIGIKLAERSIAERCTVSRVSGSVDSFGIHAEESCIVRECTVSHALYSGILAGRATRVIDSVATNCAFAGFQAIDGSRLSGCIANDNGGHGFFAMSGASFTECTAESNDGHGFQVYEHCVVRDCNANRNGADIHWGTGIYVVGNGNTVHRNTVADNDVWGVRVEAGTDYNVVAEIHAYGHGSAGGNIAVPNYAGNFLSHENLVGERNRDANGNYLSDQ